MGVGLEPGAVRCLGRFIMPRSRLPYFFSNSGNMGKVLRRLSFSGSAA